GQRAFHRLASSPRFEGLVKKGNVTGFTQLSSEEQEIFLGELRRQNLRVDPAAIVEQPRVWFPSYPHEWPAEMLHAAGVLTLDLAETLLDEGLGLKDATPLNVLFNGPHPTLVDLLSIEERDPHISNWQALGQF